MKKIELIVNINSIIKVALVSTIAAFSTIANAQTRPVPEPAPALDLPDSSSEVEEELIAPISKEEEGSNDEAVQESKNNNDIEVVTGTNTNTLHRWPTNREIPSGLVVLAFDEVSIDETLGFIAQTTGKVVIPVSTSSLRAKKNYIKK